jgi:hypothetical protein
MVTAPNRGRKFLAPGPPTAEPLPRIAVQDEMFLTIDDYNCPQRQRRLDRKSAVLFWSKDREVTRICGTLPSTITGS